MQNYEALKYHWSDTRLPVTINVTPISIDQLDTATAQVLASYRYKDIEAIQNVEDIPGGFVIISRPYGRMVKIRYYGFNFIMQTFELNYYLFSIYSSAQIEKKYSKKSKKEL